MQGVRVRARQYGVARHRLTVHSHEAPSLAHPTALGDMGQY